MAKYHIGKEGLTKLIVLTQEALKTKLGISELANGTKKLGTATVDTNGEWGIQEGSCVTDISSEESKFQLRRNCPTTYQMSAVVNGYFYQRGGTQRVLDTSERQKKLITLAAISWNTNKEQKVTTISGIKSDESLQAIFPTPVQANWKEYYEAGIVGFVTAENEMTFYCLGDKPSKDLQVYIYITELA